MFNSPEDKKLVEKVRYHFMNILEREPDKESLKYFFAQIKNNHINVDDLPKVLTESEEYQETQNGKITDSPEDKKLVEKVRYHFMNILEREPDKESLKYFFAQIKNNHINVDDLPKVLTESEEYEWVHPVKTTGESLEQQIKNEWDARAKMDPIHAVYAGAKNIKQFWNSGERDIKGIIGYDKKFFQILTRGNPKSMKVLEIGCGIGRLLIPMSKIFGGVVGVDVSPEMIRIGKENVKHIPNCKLFENNGKDLSMFSDNSFDFCYAHFIFQHIPDKEIIKNYLSETARVLKKDSFFKLLIRSKTHDDNTTVSSWNGIRFSPSEFSNLAKEFHFEIFQMEYPENEFFWITLKNIHSK